MSAAALLDELESAGVRLFLAGDALGFQTRPGVSIAPYRERITASKPALIAALRTREPIVATDPTAGRDGTLPAGCGWPHLCRTLGPCPRYPYAPCRYERNEYDEISPRLRPEEAERLKAAIVDAAIADSLDFDRAEFDRLWALWAAHEAAEAAIPKEMP